MSSVAAPVIIIKCRRCNVEKNKKEMHSSTSYNKCKDCVNEEIQEKIANGEQKTCPVCKDSKTWEHFWIGKDSCKECQGAKRKQQKEERKKDTTTMKKCNTCNEEKSIQEFTVRCAKCKACAKDGKQEYLKSTRAHRTEMTRKYRENHPEYVKKDLENTKAYNKAHRAEISAKERQRKIDDPAFKLRKDMRDYINNLIVNYGNNNQGDKYKRAMSLLDCEIKFLRDWIEHQFDDDMTWENKKDYWHLDHITPVSSFDLLNEEDIKKCFHWSNLQPLEKTKNMKKSKKIDQGMIDEKKKLAEEFKHNYKQ